MLDTLWILAVVRISARLKRRLAGATRRDQRINAVHDSDIVLQRADLDYATRDSSNNVHFLLARLDVAIEPEAYARLALGPGAELNAMGVYVWYYLRALAQAGASTIGGLEAAGRVGLGLEGVLSASSDGLVFAEAGLRQDAATLGAARLLGRTALTARLRVPF